MYAETLEASLNVKPLIDRLEKRLDWFMAKEGLSPKDTLHFLRDVKVFFHKDKDFRLELFKRSRLSGTDCLTMASLAVLLANRKGLKAKVAVPRETSRTFHAVVVYPEEKANKVFIIVGRRTYQNPRVIPPSEVKRRLYVTKPLVKVVGGVTRKIRQFRRRRK